MLDYIANFNFGVNTKIASPRKIALQMYAFFFTNKYFYANILTPRKKNNYGML